MKTTKKKVAPPPAPAAIAPHFDFEREAFASGHRWVAGVDEVGRGPLAGPVGVAAVILDPDDLPEGLDDSKVLLAGARESLCEIIFAKALSVSVAFASVEEIDLFNIRGAALRAMARALAALSLRPHFALIDGRDLPDGLICPARPIIDGDALSMSIAAASIVAKTMRDALMRNLGRDYPAIWFRRARRLRDRRTPPGARLLGPVSLSPALVPARSGRRKAPVQKGFKRVEIKYPLERLTPYENDTAAWRAA